ncbi:MAG: sensor histidine kinase, partial [Actinomycetota bacterium]
TQSITLFNKGAEAIFGFAAGEAIGQSLDILLPECLQAAHHRHVALFLASPDVTRPMGERLDIVGRRKDGSEFPAAASISKLQLGRETILTVILRDITEAKEAEAAIRALNRDMEIRADQLEALNKELEAFSYSVSHDLRAPLRAIRAFSRMLADGCGDQLGDDERQYLTRILEAGERMSHLIEDLLSLSLANRGEMNRGDVDMSEMARTVAQELRAGQSERQVEFIIEGGVHANGDPRLLRVMLENLLGNAWKYTGKQPAARIEFGTSRLADGGITYFVRDNGAGFDMQYADRLFKAFQRLHGASDFPGTGIGLATTQRIVHRHGGKIWAEGAPEHGATFYFTLA